MIQFIPFFRMYTDYITRKGERQDALEKLPKKTRKFKEFCEVEKVVTGVKLKQMLKAPLERLPQYLRFMAQVYGTFQDKECQAALDIFECIQKIAEVTDAIASKAKDAKARRQVGLLQNSMFQNKIKLAIPSRFVVKHEDLAICVAKSNVTVSLVLFNDILILAMAPAGFMGRCKLENAWPLKGLTVSTKVDDPDTDSQRYRFSVTRRRPDGEINVMILICKAEEQLNVWVTKISEWIDRAEHSRRPVNPVQLMRRLRGQRTKGDGAFDTIQITDPKKLREIEAWEEDQRVAKQAKRDRRATQRGSSPPDIKKTNSTPERRNGNAHMRGRGPPPGVAGKKPSRAAPRRPYAPPGGKKAPKSGPPPIPHHPAPQKHNAPKAPPRPPSFNPGAPPSNRPGSLPQPSQNKKPKKPAFLADIGNARKLKSAPQPERKSGSDRPSRLGLFAQIQAGTNLKKVKPRSKKKVAASTVASDLEMNIARYRKYVCDSEEETKSDSSDEEWD